jgi:hypothetical protein
MTVPGALSSFRELGEMSPHKRPSINKWGAFVFNFARQND